MEQQTGSVLVVGGAGYIGSHMVYRLIEQGKDVVVIDNLSTGHQEAIHEKARFYKGDICNREFLEQVLEREQIEYVIHFAANSLVKESTQNPLKYYVNNLYGTIVLLEALVEHHIDKIVFSSSAATYGQPEKMPITEDMTTHPTNPYGETKLAMERLFHWVEQAHGIRYVSLRYFNACGAHESGEIGEAHNPETHLIPLVLQVASGKREEIQIFGEDYNTKDGTCVRDYVHVCDLADAHMKAMEYLQKGNPSAIFNLGSGTGFSVKEVIEVARKVTKQPIDAVVKERRPGDPDELVAASEKAREILGWSPKYDNLEDMISSAWKWHKNPRF